MSANRQSIMEGNLRLRARILQSVRLFFIQNDFLEVETPIRIAAPAPERHIEAVPSGDFCLQASPELFMKRLLAAGYRRIFQICKCFRGNERGKRHLPEFTLLEWYAVESGYDDMIGQCEALIRWVATDLGLGGRFDYQGNPIDLTLPWPRISVAEAFDRWGGVSPEKALSMDRFDEIMVEAIEPRLGVGSPTFLYDYPVECGSLARRDPKNEGIAQRFELYISGLELCNAFVELTDPAEQRRRFEQERAAIRQRRQVTYPMPEHFLSRLEAMPEAAGNALGIDRLVMLLADVGSIDDVVAFTPEELLN